MVRPEIPVDIYVRVSRVGKRENLISPEEQEMRARKEAQAKGLKIGKVLVDLDESGGKLNRPGLSEALSRVENGQSGGLIVAWLDRLSRDSEHAHGFLRRIDEAGGKLYAPDAPADMQSPEGELQVGILFAFAQYMRKRARGYFAYGREQAIAQGIQISPWVPPGYIRDEDRSLKIDPKVAPIIRKMFELRAKGVSTTEISKFLYSKGIKSTKGRIKVGGKWKIIEKEPQELNRQSVYKLIRCRTYLGEVSSGGFIKREAHKAIVDLATWTAAQHPHGKITPITPKSTNRYLLNSLLRCEQCGYCMRGTKSSHGTRIYRCARGGLCESQAYVNADSIEEKALEAFWTLIGDLSAKGTRNAGQGMNELRSKLNRAEERFEQIQSAESQDALGEAWAATAKARRIERDELARKLGEAQVQETTTIPDEETLRGNWGGMGIQEKRIMLADVIGTISVNKAREMTVYPVGSEPEGLPRRGYRQEIPSTPFSNRPVGAAVLSF